MHESHKHKALYPFTLPLWSLYYPCDIHVFARPNIEITLQISHHRNYYWISISLLNTRSYTQLFSQIYFYPFSNLSTTISPFHFINFNTLRPPCVYIHCLPYHSPPPRTPLLISLCRFLHLSELCVYINCLFNHAALCARLLPIYRVNAERLADRDRPLARVPTNSLARDIRAIPNV